MAIEIGTGAPVFAAQDEAELKAIELSLAKIVEEQSPAVVVDNSLARDDVGRYIDEELERVDKEKQAALQAIDDSLGRLQEEEKAEAEPIDKKDIVKQMMSTKEPVKNVFDLPNNIL